MVELDRCPICGSDTFTKAFECTDHVVSGEQFRIVECSRCGFKFTNPRPEAENIGAYYEDEDYIPHSNEKRGIIGTAYHLVRRYTIRKKHRMAVNTNAGQTGTLMDYGCGTGEYLNLCRSKGWKIEGLEPDAEARQFAARTYDLDVHRLERIHDLPDDHFDVITLWHVLEHIPNLHEAIDNLKRVLSPEGALLVAVPNCASFDADLYGSFWAGYDVPRHLYHFRPKDIDALFADVGLSLDRKIPLKFDAYYVSMLSETHQGGFLPKGIGAGLLSNLYSYFSDHSFSSYVYVLRTPSPVPEADESSLPETDSLVHSEGAQ